MAQGARREAALVQRVRHPLPAHRVAQAERRAPQRRVRPRLQQRQQSNRRELQQLQPTGETGEKRPIGTTLRAGRSPSMIGREPKSSSDS
eukprot:6712568-Pyramimonas_sp.AAC.1